jgi:hypothetical protein
MLTATNFLSILVEIDSALRKGNVPAALERVADAETAIVHMQQDGMALLRENAALEARVEALNAALKSTSARKAPAAPHYRHKVFASVSQPASASSVCTASAVRKHRA